jgi:hypothetical protein
MTHARLVRPLQTGDAYEIEASIVINNKMVRLARQMHSEMERCQQKEALS